MKEIIFHFTFFIGTFLICPDISGHSLLRDIGGAMLCCNMLDSRSLLNKILPEILPDIPISSRRIWFGDTNWSFFNL